MKPSTFHGTSRSSPVIFEVDRFASPQNHIIKFSKVGQTLEAAGAFDPFRAEISAYLQRVFFQPAESEIAAATDPAPELSGCVVMIET